MKRQKYYYVLIVLHLNKWNENVHKIAFNVIHILQSMLATIRAIISTMFDIVSKCLS